MKGNSFQDRENVISDQDRIGELVKEKNWLNGNGKIALVRLMDEDCRVRRIGKFRELVELVKYLNWSIWW